MNNFTRHDAERLETLTKTVSGFRKKAGLTTLDLLIACRFELASKYEWEEAIEAAQERHEAFCAYYDTGRNEENAADRKIAALEAEIAQLREAKAVLEDHNEVMRAWTNGTNGIGRVA